MSRLLIVDDEERIRDIIKKYAQFEGFETVEAVDGLQAVEICRKESFDLIIMDVMTYGGLTVDFTGRLVCRSWTAFPRCGKSGRPARLRC